MYFECIRLFNKCLLAFRKFRLIKIIEDFKISTYLIIEGWKAMHMHTTVSMLLFII